MNKKLREIFIRHKNFFNKGIGEITAFKSIISLYLLVAVYLKTFNLNVSVFVLVMFTLLFILGCWVVGFMWDKAHLYDEEREFDNKRNPFVKEFRKKRFK